MYSTSSIIALVLFYIADAEEVSGDNPSFEINLCDSGKTVLSDVREGFLSYDSAFDNTRYDWCSCVICDKAAAEYRTEDYFRFYAHTILFYIPSQSLNYSYPYGQGQKSSDWKNNTAEGSFGTSLFLNNACVNFTLFLNAQNALVKISMDFIANRSEVLVKCKVKGPDIISDSSAGEFKTDAKELDVEGLGIGLGIAILVVVLATIGLSVYCRIQNKRSRRFPQDEFNSTTLTTYNPSYDEEKMPFKPNNNHDTTPLQQKAPVAGNQYSEQNGYQTHISSPNAGEDQPIAASAEEFVEHNDADPAVDVSTNADLQFNDSAGYECVNCTPDLDNKDDKPDDEMMSSRDPTGYDNATFEDNAATPIYHEITNPGLLRQSSNASNSESNHSDNGYHYESVEILKEREDDSKPDPLMTSPQDSLDKLAIAEEYTTVSLPPKNDNVQSTEL